MSTSKLSKTEEDRVKDMLKYAKKLIGIKYVWWKGDGTDPKDMFYFEIEENPSIEDLRKRGVNCSGFFTLLYRHACGGVPEYRTKCALGGIGYWYYYFRKYKMLEKFDYTKDYPLGTVFFRRYRNVKDQGHVAVFYKKYKKDPKKILYGTIIHATSLSDPDGHIDHSVDFPEGGLVSLRQLGMSQFGDFYPEGYFEYVITPDKWLKKCE